MPLLLALQRLLFFSICIALAGCQTSSNVIVDYDTGTNFSNFQTYDWLAADKGTANDIDPLLAQRVQQALRTKLLDAGFHQAVSQQQADIWVRYQIAAQTRSQQPQSGGSISFGGGSGGNTTMGVSLSFPLGGDIAVKEVELMIDLVNVKNNKLIWRGSKIFKLAKQSPAEMTAVVDAAVAEILAFYPPKRINKTY